MPMLSFDTDAGHFHVRAVAVCIHNESVLIHQTPGHAMWFFPGGRVHLGESSQDALVREMAEELNSRLEIHRLLATLEVTDHNFNGKIFHEISMYYEATLLDIEWQSSIFRGPEQHIPTDFWWCPFQRLNDTPLIPTSIKHMIHSQHREYCHIHITSHEYTEVAQTFINTQLSK